MNLLDDGIKGKRIKPYFLLCHAYDIGKASCRRDREVRQHGHRNSRKGEGSYPGER